MNSVGSGLLSVYIVGTYCITQTQFCSIRCAKNKSYFPTNDNYNVYYYYMKTVFLTAAISS